MCGIIGAVTQRDVVPILLDGLFKLEYRGYDSSGMMIIGNQGLSQRIRSKGKIVNLQKKILQHSINGTIGLAHTRWATHGAPSEENAHPHISRSDNFEVNLVHNGIIENYAQLKEELGEYQFESSTDSEVVAHYLHQIIKKNNLKNTNLSKNNLTPEIANLRSKLEGAYALGIYCSKDPEAIYAMKNACPLIIGIGIGENFISSDVKALLSVTSSYINLEDGDLARISKNNITIYDKNLKQVKREIKKSSVQLEDITLDGKHSHFMHKEIFEQPNMVENILSNYLKHDMPVANLFGAKTNSIFQNINRILIVGCGTSFHAGMVAKYWLEEIAQIPCSVNIASEYRYANSILEAKTLVVAVSQSGETADTISIVKELRNKYPKTKILSFCNVPESTLTSLANLHYMTCAGPEIGVASTKAFTAQLVGFAFLVTEIGLSRKTIDKERARLIMNGLKRLPSLVRRALAEEKNIKKLAIDFVKKSSAIFIGRGSMYPIALEGALKLKEITYIHAEAHPAGELKHGPLALIDENIPIVAIVPNNELLDKVKSNLEEVRSRNGKLYVFTELATQLHEKGLTLVHVTKNAGRITAPIIYNIPLQLLAYHVALIKGTDIDQPRNLAKSVTVE